MISPAQFAKAVVHIQQYKSVECEGMYQKEAASVLLLVNKKLYEFTKMIQERKGSEALIKTMEATNLLLGEECGGDMKCCLCESSSDPTTSVVLPHEDGVITGFYVCTKSCIDVILTVYNLARLESRMYREENTERLYKETLSELNTINLLLS